MMHGLTYAELAVEHDRARAEIERLRAELARLRGLPHMDRLSKDRNAVIEECAQIATQLIVCLSCGSDVTEKVAAAIRALKEEP